MFNKYRGQPQIKNMIRSSEKDAFVRKQQPKTAVKDEIDDASVISAIDDVAETTNRFDAENESARQKEEDEWFRRFKGEPLEEPVSADSASDEELESVEETVMDQEPHEETGEPILEVCEDVEEPERSEDATLMHSETAVTEDIEKEENELFDNEIEEMVKESAVLREDMESDITSDTASVVEEDSEPIEPLDTFEEPKSVEEDSDIVSEEDDEKWIQDLLSDIQEKTGPAVDEGSIEDENSQPLVIAVSESKEPLEAVDESDWYQSTPLIRTAALIVLDLTEPVDEEYVEETPEDEEFYQSNTEETEEAELVPEPEEFSEPIDEEYVEDSEDDPEEITIDDVDEKLASLMEDEPKTDLDMDEMLDNMDRIIQQTEPTPVKFMEETTPAPQPRVNPNRNRKKKKKKKR